MKCYQLRRTLVFYLKRTKHTVVVQAGRKTNPDGWRNQDPQVQSQPCLQRFVAIFNIFKMRQHSNRHILKLLCRWSTLRNYFKFSSRKIQQVQVIWQHVASKVCYLYTLHVPSHRGPGSHSCVKVWKHNLVFPHINSCNGLKNFKYLLWSLVHLRSEIYSFILHFLIWLKW